MLFETTPDTSYYMNLGYVLSFVVMGIYVASIYIRNRNLDQDTEALNGILAAESGRGSKKEAPKKAPKKPAPKKKPASKKK
jgi:hypothetical protein